MADYIERQAAIDAIDETDWYHQNRNGEMVHGANSAEDQPWYKSDDVYKALESVPPVDAVEVIRCKDCKYQDKGENESESWNVCNYRPWLYFSINDDDYCSNGEREDG